MLTLTFEANIKNSLPKWDRATPTNKKVRFSCMKNWVLKKHNKTLCDWFKNTIFAYENASETLRKLADEPKRNVITWQGYDINKYSFYTKA